MQGSPWPGHICMSQRELATLGATCQANKELLDKEIERLEKALSRLSNVENSHRKHKATTESALKELSDLLRLSSKQWASLANIVSNLEKRQQQIETKVAVHQVEYNAFLEKNNQMNGDIKVLKKKTETHGKFLWKLGVYISIGAAVVGFVLSNVDVVRRILEFLVALCSEPKPPAH